MLALLFRRTLVAQVVLDECLAWPTPAIRAAADMGLFKVQASEPIAETALGPGKRSAITLAQAHGALLLADDRAARRYAKAAGLCVVSIQRKSL